MDIFSSINIHFMNLENGKKIIQIKNIHSVQFDSLSQLLLSNYRGSMNPIRNLRRCHSITILKSMVLFCKNRPMHIVFWPSFLSFQVQLSYHVQSPLLSPCHSRSFFPIASGIGIMDSELRLYIHNSMNDGRWGVFTYLTTRTYVTKTWECAVAVFAVDWRNIA